MLCTPRWTAPTPSCTTLLSQAIRPLLVIGRSLEQPPWILSWAATEDSLAVSQPNLPRQSFHAIIPFDSGVKGATEDE